jgi:hypothetical protein
MSAVQEALLVNAVVLVLVLQADLGSHRAITWRRILRPIVLACIIVPLFLRNVAGRGTGLALEIDGVGAGTALGLAAAMFTDVYRSPRTGRPVTRAGAGYAAVWIAVIGARSAFSYGSAHWFSAQVGAWLSRNELTVDGLTDAIVLMAVAMLVTRTLSIELRAKPLRRSAAVATAGPARIRRFPTGDLGSAGRTDRARPGLRTSADAAMSYDRECRRADLPLSRREPG